MFLQRRPQAVGVGVMVTPTVLALPSAVLLLATG